MSFFYIIFLVNKMKVYIDLVFLLNLYLDFLLLLTASIVLKRNVSLKRIFLGSCVGSFTIFFLFFKVISLFLFFFKMIIAILMVIVAFKYENLRYTFNNLIYFYMISIILGGFLYYLNIEFSYTPVGLFFVRHKLNVNAIFLIIISPIILYLYVHQTKKMKSSYSLSYKVKIVLKNEQEYELNGFLDTGNKLVDPITNKPIILLEEGIINEQVNNFYYIPFHSLNNNNLLKCLRPKYIEIENKKFNNYLVGISDKKFALDGVKCILNNKLLEEL